MSTKRDTLLDEARARLGRGDMAGGERSLKKLLRMRPADADGLYLLGIVQLQAGKAAAAASLMRRALDSGLPADPVVLENLGTAHLMNGAAVDAERELRRAVDAGGTRSMLHMRLGMALAAQDRLDEAEAMMRMAQEADPGDIDIGINLGNVLASRGAVDAAMETYARLLQIAPGHVQVLYNIGTLLREAGRLEEAIPYYLQVLDREPDHVATLINLGTVQENLGRYDEAEAMNRKVLSAEPGNVIALSNLSSVLRAQRRLDEAAACCQRALELRPDFVDAVVNLAGIRADQGQLDAARQAYLKAWKLAPDDTEAQLWYGMLGLVRGEFAESWPHYLVRGSRRDVAAAVGTLDDRLPPDLNGLTVLLVGEQGIGDELFFLRFAGMLKSRGARLVCACDRKLRTMLERTAVFDALYTHGDPLPVRDLTMAVGDLPLACGRSMPAESAIRSPLRLQPAPDRTAAMRDYLGRIGPAPYLAVTWRGGTRLLAQRNWRYQVLSKEVPLEALASAVRGFQGTILSLQRNPDPGETERFAEQLGQPVHDASALNGNLEDMLALLGLLHDYVGVSNANMHLLAGLGGRARVLVPNPAEWRWMASGDESPWFPGFTVYRQATDGQWDDAVAQLQKDLAGAAASAADR